MPTEIVGEGWMPDCQKSLLRKGGGDLAGAAMRDGNSRTEQECPHNVVWGTFRPVKQQKLGGTHMNSWYTHPLMGNLMSPKLIYKCALLPKVGRKGSNKRLPPAPRSS